MIDALPTTEIVITAERAPEEVADTAASATVIDSRTIERLGEPLVSSLIRLTPSAAVAASGPAGSFTEVRIRGAESNHTLLFIDGIRANDPATGNQPRFDLLNADIASRIEVVRGPQSALWGSEAVGGVVAVNGLGAGTTGLNGALEAGSFGFRRASTSAALASGPANAAFALGYQRARGIDAFDGTGDRDGYRNFSGRFRGTWNAAPAFQLGLAAFGLSARSEFDGFNPAPPFQHIDTLDSSRNGLGAARAWAAYGNEDSGWSGHLGASLLGSRNRNLLAGDEINRTSGRRATVDAQIRRSFETGNIAHRLILAFDHESERFHARDPLGSTNQDRSRSHQALTSEWRADAGPVTADLALRRDAFNRFEDATTLRASVLADVGRGFSLAASYGEGIAQPTFFDLYGFSPSIFVGNPGLAPESSRGFEGSVRYSHGAVSGSLTAYRQRLHNEIVGVFDFSTGLSSTVNRSETSRRWGVEAQLLWSLDDRMQLSAAYAYLDATEPGDPGSQVREARRPRHSGSIVADGRQGRLTYGASIAYAGARRDTDFEVFPFRPVRLEPYWLAGARVAYEITGGVNLFARIANAFGATYQDALGYRTEGRSVYAGLRLAPRP